MKKIITTLPDPPWDDSVTHNLEIRDMTHAEKANKLLGRFTDFVEAGDSISFRQRYKTRLENAKQAILVVIDLILENNRELLESQLNNDFSIMDNSNNWRLIKEEIEKL